MSYKLKFHHIPAFFRAQISLKSARSYGLVGPRILFWTCFAEAQSLAPNKCKNLGWHTNIYQDLPLSYWNKCNIPIDRGKSGSYWKMNSQQRFN